jgi:parallel beta-helix repeat protein
MGEIELSTLRSSAQILAANDYWKEQDNDAIKAILDGFTPSGTFISPFNFIISKNNDVGTDYYSASNTYQTIYGGSTATNHHIGGVDGTDASAVIQAAFGAIAVVGGGSVALAPYTVFLIDTPLTLVNNLDFYGSAGSELKANAVMAAYMIVTAAVTGFENIKIHGIKFDSNELTPWTIWSTNASMFSNLEVYNCYFTNPTTAEKGGLNFYGSYINIHDNFIENIWITNIFDGAHNKFVNNHVKDPYESCISCGYAAAPLTCHDYVISGNTLDDTLNYYGIDVFGNIKNVTVSDNTILGCELSAIVIESDALNVFYPSDVTIIGNSIMEPRTNGISAGGQGLITVVGNSVYSSVTTTVAGIVGSSGCVISGNIVKGFAKGIWFGDSNAYINCTGNNVSGSIYGIFAGLTSTYSLIKGNVIHDLVGVTTYGIYAVDGGTYDIIEGNIIDDATNGIATDTNGYCTVEHNTLTNCVNPIVGFLNVNGNIVRHNMGYLTEFSTGGYQGNGAEQTIAHGLVAHPINILVTSTQTGTTFTNVYSDVTNIYVTATNGHFYNVKADVTVF